MIIKLKYYTLIKNYSMQTYEEEELEFIVYGLKILGTSILTSIIILLSGIILGQPISAVIYLSILIMLRRNVGGYHSKTYLGCLFITIISFFIIILLENVLIHNHKEIIGIIFIIYSTIKIYMTIPHAHKNRIINKETIENCNTKKNLNLSIILFIALVSHIFIRLDFKDYINYFFVISSSLAIVALSINKIIIKEGKEI